MPRRGRRDFGAIRKRSSGRWQATYFASDGMRRSLGMFPSKATAVAALAATQTAMHSGTWIDSLKSAMTVGEVSKSWLASNPHKRANSFATDVIDIDKHIVPAIGNRSVGAVRPAEIQRLVNSWAEDAAPRTVLRRLGTLRAIFNFAVNNDWLSRSPVRHINRPRVTSTRRFALTDEQVTAIAEATVEEYQAMVWVGALTGCRWSEVAGLRVSDLDLLARTMRIAQVVVKDGSGHPFIAPPKSEASKRVIGLPDALVDILAEHLARMRLDARDSDELVFQAPEGGPLYQDNWRRRVWLPALMAVGLDDPMHRPGFHDLRRAVATALVAAGIDPRTVQNRLGHSDVRTTLGLYAQVVDARDRSAAELLASRYMGNIRDRSRPQRARTRRQSRRGKAIPPLTWEDSVEVSGLEPPTSTLRT